MQADDVFRDYLEMVKQDPVEFYRDYLKTINRVAAKYRDCGLERWRNDE